MKKLLLVILLFTACKKDEPLLYNLKVETRGTSYKLEIKSDKLIYFDEFLFTYSTVTNAKPRTKEAININYTANSPLNIKVYKNDELIISENIQAGKSGKYLIK